MITEPVSSPTCVEVFFDGQCPLCLREIRVLRWMDRRERIRFTDISAAEFSPEDYHRSMDELMAEIHGRLPGGQWIVGVEVFRQLYAAVGFGPLVWISRAPIVSHALEFGYRVFAKHRLRLTGRCSSGRCDIDRPANDSLPANATPSPRSH